MYCRLCRQFHTFTTETSAEKIEQIGHSISFCVIVLLFGTQKNRKETFDFHQIKLSDQLTIEFMLVITWDKARSPFRPDGMSQPWTSYTLTLAKSINQQSTINRTEK
ncbi:CLUMA_CG018550, isoform A [Clunio marinus]|uniref:CLUMA_CG018550, isoform A n=1 Tax=Clunio marinus TaxID=568069 RepID=A0A1J1IZU9_9DIPT|nr:CLUMA_CG018550, isoform A [Clunio marinus]